MCIKGIVRDEMDDAASDAIFYAVPFPGHGNQTRFRRSMMDILPSLPRGG